MSKTIINRREHRTELQLAVRECRPAFLVVGLFSLVINLLMLAPAIYMLQVYDRVLTTGSFETLLMLTIIAGIVLLVISVMESYRTNITIRTGVWLNDRVGPALIERGVRARIDGNATDGQPMRDLTQVQSFVATNGLSFLFDAPWLPVYLLLIWLLHPVLGVVALVGALLMLLLTLVNNLLTRKATLTANTQQIAATQHIDAAFRNAEAVRAMGMVPAVIALWRQKNAIGMGSLIAGAETGGTMQSATRFVRLFLQSGILGLGALLVIKGEMSGGAMIAASILLGRAMSPVELAITAWRNVLVTRAAYNRIQLLLSRTPAERKRTRLPEPTGHLTVENLTFVPPDLGQPVLRRVSFSLEPGEALAVIGPSAAGKSTLARFLVGLAKPTSGSVRLDGFDLDDWDREQLGRAIGYLPQAAELFSGSVRANISRMELAADDASVTDAARLAHAHDMIAGLRNGYDCEIGDGGAHLSAGQRQRIGLARAVYGNPRLIVLDEPNANLDTSGESALAAALAVLKARGCTLIIIGHRPSTLAQADKLMLLRDGVAELLGPREEVLQKLRNAAQAKNSIAAKQADVEPNLPNQNVG
jgi:ATP-binding cassette subfamily C protein/ATP-binding cassette subfamily C exporter for protease/lipase/ATP-binding cassette subfamily C protein EexD